MTLRIAGGQVCVGETLVEAVVEIVGDRIASVSAGHGPGDIDAAGLIVAPGFVDLQINGGFGIDLASEPDGIWGLGALLPQTGVTSFLPTIVSSTADVTSAALRSLHERPDDYSGAEPLGLHFEGPMLNPARRGAHDLRRLATPGLALVEGWSRRAGVRLVTLAPELPGALDVISALVRRQVVVAAGHTDADSAAADAAIQAGLAGVTHLFNAMAPIGHRNPNLAGLALADPRLVAGLIVDHIHVDPVMVSAAWNAKGPSGIALVTDAVASMGLPAGTHRLGGGLVTSDETGVRTVDGVLAGSRLTMDQAVRNLDAATGCGSAAAIVSASMTPADLIGEAGRGRLGVGTTADLVLLGDDLAVELTICAGQVTYASASGRDRLRQGGGPD